MGTFSVYDKHEYVFVCLVWAAAFRTLKLTRGSQLPLRLPKVYLQQWVPLLRESRWPPSRSTLLVTVSPYCLAVALPKSLV